MMASGGWLGRLVFLVNFIATSWTNLQACKISSIVEIPKLDPVRQKESALSVGVLLYCVFGFVLEFRTFWFLGPMGRHSSGFSV